MARIKVKVVRLAHAHGLELPAYQTQGAAGMDLLAAVGEGRPVVIAPGKRALIPTGLVLELPKGYEAQVRPRSGLALRNGITVLNSPGTIDSDYRGEVGVLLVNLGDAKFKVERGARIAQLVVQKVETASLVEVTQTAQSARGAGGFGSTGVATGSGAGNEPKKGKRGARIKEARGAGAARASATPPRQNGKTGAHSASPRNGSGKAKERPPLVNTNPQNRLRLNARRRGAGAARLKTRASPRSP